MDSMKDIRNRISSVQKTMRITNAMHLMASSKLKKAKKALAQTEPYFVAMKQAISRIIAHTDLAGERYFATDRVIAKENMRHGYVIITSDRGLAGAYNQNVCKAAEVALRRRPDDVIFCIGHYGQNYCARHPELAFRMEEEFCFPAGIPSIWRAREMADRIIEDFLTGEFDAIHVVYTRMVNAMTTETVMLQLLPLIPHMFPDNDTADTAIYTESFDPSPEQVLHMVVPNYVKGMLYSAMVESYAAEQNARMTAMDSATRNAKEIVSALSLEYNRLRQAGITTQLTEVIGGASAQE